MPITSEEMARWCHRLSGGGAAPRRTLEEYIEAIPRLATLGDLPAGTAVLVRGDLDVKPGPRVGDGDVRLRSMRETIEFGRTRGWKQVLFGHVGRKPEGSLSAVARRLSEILGAEVELISDWLDEQRVSVAGAASERIAAAAPGSVLVLENTRRYAIERVLWDASADDVEQLATPLAKLANEMAQKVARVYVNEAFSAGSLDSSTTVVPAAMERVALGAYVAREFDGPMRRCLASSFVVFSGLKIDKLDDLAAMIDRGSIRRVLAAGSLAMALAKATAELDGRRFCLGVAEDASHADKPYYIPPDRIAQARRLIENAGRRGIEFILPVDYVLADGRIVTELGASDQQFDVGPKSSELFERKVGELIAENRARREGEPPPVVFHNGVFGMFEDTRFENGTRRFITQLKRMTDAGIEVYVGGGEGGTALEQYGKLDWVTHCFTAGGTVLNALGSQPVPYLVALQLASERLAS